VGFVLDIPHASVNVIQWGVVVSASLVAAVGDIRRRRIPNALTFPLFLVGLIWAVCFGGLSGAGKAVGSCLILAAPYVILFIFAGGGAGDAKLMGAIGTWLGLKQSVVVLLCVVVAGAILALAKAASQRQLKFVLTNVLISFYSFLLCVAGGRKPGIADGEERTESDAGNRLDVPYGVAIATGVCVATAIVALGGTEWLRS